MKTNFWRLISCGVLLCAATKYFVPRAMAQNAVRPLTAADVKLPANGTSVLPVDSLAAFQIAGDSKAAQSTLVAVQGQSFTQAVRFQIPKKPDRDYGVRFNAKSIADVKKGDVLVATFLMRGVNTKDESGDALSAFVWEQKDAPFDKSADVHLSAPIGIWKKFVIPFAAKQDFPAGSATIQFRLGLAAQTFELGGVSVINYGTAIKLSDFPKPVITYNGRELDAPWRKAALERIERIRKADLTLIIKDAQGKAVRGAQVKIAMHRHAFGFGSVINTGRMWRGKTPQELEDQKKYREMFLKLFNISVDEGSHKWPAWSNPKLQEEVRRTVLWLRENNIQMRGHVMVWPSWSNSPTFLKRAYDETVKKDGQEAGKTYLRQTIRDHIFDIGSTFKGQLRDWDVVNETYTNSDLQEILGRQALVDWFKWAKEADQTARLFINENTILAPGGRKRDFYEKEIKYLLDNGAPLEGIGMQGHIGTPTPPEELLRTFDRFAKFKLPIQVTEFDFGLVGMDEQLQADFLRDFHIAAFSHPAVTDIVMWGFWEGQHWRPFKALWRKDWTIKPNGQAWLDLVHKQWWTNATGQTNSKGKLNVRGFQGDYNISVSHNGKTLTVPTRLPKEGRTLEIVLR